MRRGMVAVPEHKEQGNNMTDTIELLEAIGSDASLRYAQVDELRDVLEQAQVGAKFAVAVALGDGAPLRDELGLQQVPQTNAPGHGDDEEEETDIPLPEQPLPGSPAK